jgi:hypothetical protein
MKQILILIVLCLPALGDVPKGIDSKWDRTLTVVPVRTGKGNTMDVKVTATAPPGGPIYVSGTGGSMVVPAGKTVVKRVKVPKDYIIVAKYKGRVLDFESNRRKTGLGHSALDKGGKLGDRKKFGR